MLQCRKSEAPPARQRQPDALSFNKGGYKRHCQSRSENETALSLPGGIAVPQSSAQRIKRLPSARGRVSRSGR